MATGFVYIIESPADSDLLNGRTEGRLLCEALRLADIPHRYSLVTTPRTFEESLGTRFNQAVSDLNQLPTLHLSMHGNNEGVALTNGQFLTWANLRKSLAPLTDAMQGLLLICMSSCFSSSGCRMAMHEEKDHPFWALVGNTDSVSWPDAAVAYITFYHLLFKDVPVEQCVERMSIASGDYNFRLISGHAVKAAWAAITEKIHSDAIAAFQSRSSANTGTLSGLFGQQLSG
ncbi:MAG: hypothetical protein ACLP5H_10180 [Desulfomonilaceae bacterium]